MTDTNTTPADDLQLFDDAPNVFPSKSDLANRLVAIWVTGRTGTRKGENGQPYPWVETVTVVCDDGPDGWQAQVMDYDTTTMRDNLVPSVADNGPQRLDAFQWSASGLTSRLMPRVTAKSNRPMIGRINVRPNQKKGLAPPWSISTATNEDKEQAARVLGPLTRQIMAEVEKMHSGAADVSAFD